MKAGESDYSPVGVLQGRSGKKTRGETATGVAGRRDAYARLWGTCRIEKVLGPEGAPQTGKTWTVKGWKIQHVNCGDVGSKRMTGDCGLWVRPETVGLQGKGSSGW